MEKLSRIFSRIEIHRFDRVSDHHLEDDWELIGVLDQEFAGEVDKDGDCDNGDEMIDPVEPEDSHTASVRLEFRHKIRYKILSKSDVHRLLEEMVARVSAVLSLSRSDVITLLLHFNWNDDKAQEEWLTCEEKVRKAVGLLDTPGIETSHTDEKTCIVCHESYGADHLLTISCGHPMCRICWTEYIGESINNGPVCLALRCPDTSCEAVVGFEMIEFMATPDEKEKLYDYLLKSFIASSKKAKWCPAPGCEYAVSYFTNVDDIKNVTCQNLHSFCLNCSEEAHTPVDCVQVSKWKLEIFAQSSNWLLSNARPCPSCERLFDENSCQIYSRCPNCHYFFPRAETSESDESTELSAREIAKSALARYQQYYLGWSNSDTSRQNALTELTVLKEIKLPLLYGRLDLPASELDFLIEAHIQVVDCWQLVKWMYVYGFFLPENELVKKNLFDFMLEQATKLVRMLEKHVDELAEELLGGEILSEQHDICRVKLVQLTRVARNNFDRMVEALKSGLSEVVSSSTAGPSLKTDYNSPFLNPWGSFPSLSPYSSPSLSPCNSSLGQSSSPTRKVVKSDGEGVSSPVVSLQSDLLMLRLSTKREKCD